MRLHLLFLLAFTLNLGNVFLPRDLSSVKGNKSYSSDTFQFEYPKNWHITDEEQIDDEIFYLSIEKKGINDSGIYTIVSYEGEYYLDELIDLNVEELKTNTFLKGLKKSENKDGSFSHYEGRNATFNFTSFGLKHSGEIFTFMTETHTFYVLRQGADEDESKNKEGFQLIEQSFKAK